MSAPTDRQTGTRRCLGGSPPDHVLSFSAQPDVFREPQLVPPIDNLAVRVVRVLGAKRRVPDQTFKHDRAQRPPVALLAVPLLEEDLGRDVIRRADRRVGEFAPVRLPRRDRIFRIDRQVDRVDHDRVPAAVHRTRDRPSPFGTFQQALVVRRVVLFVEPGRETEIRQLDVSVLVDQNVVGFDVTVTRRRGSVPTRSLAHVGGKKRLADE